MKTINAKHFVDSEFPSSARAQIPGALKIAYAAVETLYQSDPNFQVKTAQIGKGHVVGWTVDRHIVRLIEAGKLPYDFRWAPFERPTGQYLQIRLGASTLSVSQLADPVALPRHAYFRENRALSNTPFLDFREFDEERQITGLPHLILSHGYQQLWFAQIGVPHPDTRREGWIYRTPNLLNAPHVVQTDEPPVEAADAEAVVTLREELTRWARDHANDD